MPTCLGVAIYMLPSFLGLAQRNQPPSGEELCKKSNLLKVVKKIFPEDYEKILHLSCFKIIKKEPYYFYQLWCEESYVSRTNTLSSIDVSEFLSQIGQDELAIELFFKEWMRESKKSGAVMFDITSISSYGTRNDFLERGYNRDGESLEQVNLGLIAYSPKSNEADIPLAYRIYPGSITDVTTLNNVTSLMKSYNLNLDILVMDKGFYSQENIKDMNSRGLKYIVPMSFNTLKSKEILLDLSEPLSSPESLFSFHNQVYAYAQKRVKISGKMCSIHVFLDKKRKADQESKFIQKISDVENFFSEKKFSFIDDAKIYLEETLKTKKKFFFIKECDGHFTIKRNITIFKNEIMKMGCLILITNKKSIRKEEVLGLYRKKDSIEKVFYSFKHDVNEKRNRTHSLITMRGSIFINFISLILITWIDHVMKEKKLYKRMTKAELYKILDRLRLYELATGDTLLGELSRQQKDILKSFELGKSVKPTHSFG